MNELPVLFENSKEAKAIGIWMLAVEPQERVGNKKLVVRNVRHPGNQPCGIVVDPEPA